MYFVAGAVLQYWRLLIWPLELVFAKLSKIPAMRTRPGCFITTKHGHFQGKKTAFQPTFTDHFTVLCYCWDEGQDFI